MLEYSEYKELIDVLNDSDRTNTYEELMKKEDKVLSNVNAIVKNYKDREHNDTQFVNWSVHKVFNKLFTEITLIMYEIYNIKTVNDLSRLFSSSTRLLLIGIFMIIIAIFLFFIEISK